MNESPLPGFVVVYSLDDGHSDGGEMDNLSEALICISLTAEDVETLFQVFAIYISSLEIYQFGSLAHLLIQ